jgi:TonB-linked SusC/RagA family outer membrane protein
MFGSIVSSCAGLLFAFVLTKWKIVTAKLNHFLTKTPTMKKIFFLTCLLVMVNVLWAQDISITGTVLSAEDGSPVPGANVTLEGTATGTITDLDGNYSISAPANGILVFSFVGLETSRVDINSQTIINVTMETSSQSMEEVVVIGYGTTKVKDLTSSIQTVKAEEIAKAPVSQPMEGLQGKVAGMQVVSSGAPGSAPTVRIRGIGSYPGSSNESPLYVVDGMFFNNINFLNSSDIESISVLKDATAAAIYGVRAANGVVLITTKTGRINQKAQISYDGYYGVNIAQNVLKMANSEQFTNMAMESGSPADSLYILNAMQRYGRSTVNPNVPEPNTDWYKEILRTGQTQNHALSIAGGGESAAYSLGINYNSDEGVLNMKNDYERFNLRSKVDYTATNWLTVGANMLLSNETRNLQQGGAWHTAYYAVPVMPVIDEQNVEAWPTQYASAEHLGYRGAKNPFAAMDFNENLVKSTTFLGNFYAKIDFIPNKLSFKTTYNQNYSTQNNRSVGLPFYISNASQREESVLTKRAANSNNIIWDNVLTYTDTYADNHNLVLMAGTSYRMESGQWLNAQGINFPVDQEAAWYINFAETIPIEQVNDGGYKQYGLSYFGRAAYNYKYKYLVYATMRADGSNKYQEKWGYFPSVGVGWVLSEEGFLENSDAVSFMKLRASWGQLGNDKIQASDGATTTSVVTTAIDDVLTSGTITSSTYSSLKWEVVEELNIGITTRFLENRLSADVDYYNRKTKNAVIRVQIPMTGGTVMKNVGVIQNSGFEFLLGWDDQVGNDFSYHIGANLTTLKNEVLDLYGQSYIDGGQAEFRQRTMVGEPLLAFFGYETNGVYQTAEEVAADPIAVDNGLVPGDFKYKDQQAPGEEGHGVINDDDRVVLGSYFPSLMYGFDLGLSWRNLEFSAMFMGQTGNKILNRKRGEIIWTNDGNMDADLAVNRWHGEGTSNKYPSSAGLRKGWNQKMSDYFVEDGSFFRIQNLQLAYNIRDWQISGAEMPHIKLSLTAMRPLTLFSYNGFNPEVANGIDRQTYPIPAIYTFGLTVNF